MNTSEKMKPRFISFGAIGQFRNVIRDISHAARCDGFDENGEPIYDNDIRLPKLAAIGSEKIHGTNAAVCYNDHIGLWAQSRKNIITVDNDNAGYAKWVQENKLEWMEIIQNLSFEHGIDLDKNIISIFMEWCGGNIQKNSAVSGLDKRAVIFQHFKISPLIEDNECSDEWVETRVGNEWIYNSENNIFNIMNGFVWRLEIDFENPLLSQNRMLEIVKEAIEPNSPLGELMGKKNNVGEGLVFTLRYKNKLHRFKVKGEKHSKTKVKTLKVVDEAKENAKIEFANYACSASRLEQAWQTVFGLENEKLEPSIKSTGDFLRVVFKDIIKEESDILDQKNLIMKDVQGKIAQIARRWFIAQLDEIAEIV